MTTPAESIGQSLARLQATTQPRAIAYEQAAFARRAPAPAVPCSPAGPEGGGWDIKRILLFLGAGAVIVYGLYYAGCWGMDRYQVYTDTGGGSSRISRDPVAPVDPSLAGPPQKAFFTPFISARTH